MKLPNLSKKLNFEFKYKPLLIGGMAMEYYGLRKTGDDIDYVIAKTDHQRLKKQLQKQGLITRKKGHKKSLKKVPEFVDLYGDQGILVDQYEVWNQIMKSDYDFLSEGAIEKKNCLIISLEKLIYLKALLIHKRKSLNDIKLIVKKIIDDKYKK